MARVKRNNDSNDKDISTYTDLGDMNWRDALVKAYSPGIDSVAVCEQMLSHRGVKRLIPRHKTRDKVMVKYDKEYVFYRMFTLFIEKLGIIKDGAFDEVKYGIIFNGLKEYCSDNFKREYQDKVLSQAIALNNRFPGNTVTHWFNVIVEQDKLKKEYRNDETAGDNKNTTSDSTRDMEDRSNDTELPEQKTVLRQDATDGTNEATGIETADTISAIETVNDSEKIKDEKENILATEIETLPDETVGIEAIAKATEISETGEVADVALPEKRKRGRPKGT